MFVDHLIQYRTDPDASKNLVYCHMVFPIVCDRVARKKYSDKGKSEAKIHSNNARARSVRGKPVYVDQATQVPGRFFSNGSSV